MSVHPVRASYPYILCGTYLGNQSNRENIMLRSLAYVSLLAVAAPALAEGPNWNYIEGSYERVEFDDDVGGFDVDGDGFGIAGSFEIADSWHAFASYGSADFDFDIDLDQLVIGGGLHTPISDNTDFVANLAYVRVDASALGFSVDDDGFGASIGVRGMMSPQVELEAYVDYVDLSDSGDDTSFRAAGWYSFTENFAAGLQIGTGDDTTSYGIGARVYFD